MIKFPGKMFCLILVGYFRKIREIIVGQIIFFFIHIILNQLFVYFCLIFVYRIIPKTGNCEDIPSGKCKIGISRIWVAQDFRKQKIATNLVLTFERYFAYGAILKKGENYAFSHTTPDGTNFASKYVGLPNGQFLTYNPCK